MINIFGMVLFSFSRRTSISGISSGCTWRLILSLTSIGFVFFAVTGLGLVVAWLGAGLGLAGCAIAAEGPTLAGLGLVGACTRLGKASGENREGFLL